MSNTFNGWNRPTLSDIKGRVFADLETNLPGKDANLRYSPLNALGSAIVGQSYEQNGYIEWGLRQATVLYCDDNNLDLHGAIWGVSRKIPTKASGTISISGIASTVLPSGTLFQTSTGLQYITTADATIVGGSATANVLANSVGIQCNLAAGVTLSLTSSITGINNTATVISITGGTDIETADNYRARILYAIQNPTGCGSASDYVQWALSQPGVTRAWCYPLEGGNGTVTVRFMMDNTYSNGIPLSGDVTSMTTFLNSKRPVTAVLTVSAPTAVPYNITITGLSNSDATTKANVTAEIKNAIVRDAQPGGIIHISRIWAAISLATGEQYFGSTTPSTDTSYTNSQIAVMGTCTFV